MDETPRQNTLPSGRLATHRPFRISFTPMNARLLSLGQLSLLSPLLISCGPTLQDYQHASSGPTGCLPQEIAISQALGTFVHAACARSPEFAQYHAMSLRASSS